MSYWQEALNESMGRLDLVSAQNNTSDSSAPTFTPFPKLPMELRLKIWKHALPGPRAIKLKHNTTNLGWYYLRAVVKTPVMPPECSSFPIPMLTWITPPLLGPGSALAQVCSGLLTHLTRDCQLLTRGPKSPPFTARDPKSVPIVHSQSVPARTHTQLSSSACPCKMRKCLHVGKFLLEW